MMGASGVCKQAEDNLGGNSPPPRDDGGHLPTHEEDVINIGGNSLPPRDDGGHLPTHEEDVINIGGNSLPPRDDGGHLPTRMEDASVPPPATWGAYATKSEESNEVVAMINLLIKDMDKEMTEAWTSQKEAQADYQMMMRE